VVFFFLLGAWWGVFWDSSLVFFGLGYWWGCLVSKRGAFFFALPLVSMC